MPRQKSAASNPARMDEGHEKGDTIQAGAPHQAGGQAPRRRRYAKPRTKVRSEQVIVKLKRARRLKANDRERNRMHNLNDALELLRKTLPIEDEQAKLTKIETLKLAGQYIWTLTEVLRYSDDPPLDLPPCALPYPASCPSTSGAGEFRSTSSELTSSPGSMTCEQYSQIPNSPGGSLYSPMSSPSMNLHRVPSFQEGDNGCYFSSQPSGMPIDPYYMYHRPQQQFSPPQRHDSQMPLTPTTAQEYGAHYGPSPYTDCYSEMPSQHPLRPMSMNTHYGAKPEHDSGYDGLPSMHSYASMPFSRNVV